LETLLGGQLPGHLPWYVGGPLIGLVVALMYAVWNEPLGVSGYYAHVARLAGRRPDTDLMRVWVFAGIVVGALLATLLQGGFRLTTAYGPLGLVLPLTLLVPLLFAGGLLIGYGARWAGGCTSGHGLAGSAALSRASVVATATFMATAVAVSFLLNWLLGGAL
jgi:uncharacterized membrane protein YedE/YeeE